MKELKPEYQEYQSDFSENYEDTGCSCHINAPCCYCTHEGHPANLSENPDAWREVEDCWPEEFFVNLAKKYKDDNKKIIVEMTPGAGKSALHQLQVFGRGLRLKKGGVVIVDHYNNINKEKKMNQTNKNVMASMLIEGLKTVRCIFNTGDGKEYTYKTIIEDLKQGDSVVVIAPNGLPRVVHVMSVDEVPALDSNASFSYKWIVQKVDLTQFDKIVKAENKFIKDLDKAEYHTQVKKLTKKLSDDVGVSMTAMKKRIKKLNKKIK